MGGFPGISSTISGVRDVVRSLTRAQRMYVRDGSIHGDCAMPTVRALRSKGLFHLVIDSPNGQCGFMRLTPLGEAVQAALIWPAKDDTAEPLSRSGKTQTPTPSLGTQAEQDR